MIANIENDLSMNRERLGQTEAILAESHKNMNIGEDLIAVIEKAIRHIEDVKKRVAEIEDGIKILNRNVSAYTVSNSEILDSTHRMNLIVTDQNTNINESVAATEIRKLSEDTGNNTKIISETKKSTG